MGVGAKSVHQRIRRASDLAYWVDKCGIAVDGEAALGVTAFCWANGMDLAGIAFDIEVEKESMYESDE
jgi:hypothetical protein